MEHITEITKLERKLAAEYPEQYKIAEAKDIAALDASDFWHSDTVIKLIIATYPEMYAEAVKLDGEYMAAEDCGEVPQLLAERRAKQTNF